MKCGPARVAGHSWKTIAGGERCNQGAVHSRHSARSRHKRKLLDPGRRLSRREKLEPEKTRCKPGPGRKESLARAEALKTGKIWTSD